MPEEQNSEAQRIVISHEDLAAESEAYTAPPPAQSYPAVAVPPTQQPPPAPNLPPPPPPPPFGAQPSAIPGRPPAAESLPGLGPQGAASYGGPAGFGTGTGITWDQFLAKLGSNAVISGVVAGALGGFIGWVFSEIFFSPDSWPYFSSTINTDLRSGVWVMIFGAFLGFVLMGWEGFTSRSPQKLFREGGIGAGIGVAAGFVGGFLAQAIYGALVVEPTGSATSYPPVDILIRGLGWAVLGLLVGLGLGIPKGGRAVLNGLIGGAAGGFVAGAVFQIIGNSGATNSGAGLRCVGLTVTGVGIGVGIGLITRVRRDAWLMFTAGPMRGKEFILQSAQTRLGSDYRCDIVLVKDSAIAPVHALFTRYPNGAVGVSPQSTAPLLVNGLPNSGTQLRSGDSVSVGNSTISYLQRAAVAAPSF